MVRLITVGALVDTLVLWSPTTTFVLAQATHCDAEVMQLSAPLGVRRMNDSDSKGYICEDQIAQEVGGQYYGLPDSPVRTIRHNHIVLEFFQFTTNTMNVRIG